MKRTHLQRSGHAGVAHHIRFRTKLRHALHHISHETGEPIHRLEAKVMEKYEALPWQKRAAFSNAVVLGGMSSAILAVGAFVPEVLPMAAWPMGIEAGVDVRSAVQRRFEKKQLKEMEAQ